jgi:hypothetical protein
LLQNYKAEAKVMKKQLVIIWLVTLLVCVGLSGCDFQSSSDVIEVTVYCSAFTNFENITKQDVRFDVQKTSGESFTLYQGWMGFRPSFETYAKTVGYNLHPGEIITVSAYHPLATPTTQTQTFTYEQCLNLVRGDEKVMKAHLWVDFVLSMSIG